MNLERYISVKGLLDKGKRYLVAVSGGIDSMVLLSVLVKGGYNILVAHCNFELRGDESEGDSALVRSVCERYGIACLVKYFDTQAYAKAHKISIEMAARDLRYEWFATLCAEYGCAQTVVAHHSDDDVETFFLNLLRGSGLRGLRGMQQYGEHVIRPFLGVSRRDIEDYAKENEVLYREDSSNKEQLYLRNRLRLDIIPRMKLINPSLNSTILETGAILDEADALLQWASKEIRAKVCRQEGYWEVVNLKSLRLYPGNITLLHGWFQESQFSKDQLEKMSSCDEESSGQRFESDISLCIHSRGELYICSKAAYERDLCGYCIDAFPGIYGELRPIEVSIGEIDAVDYLLKDKNQALLDFDKLVFPLRVRVWQPGDRIYPKGMRGSKKVSNMITDMKLSPIEKSHVMVLESDGEIVWLIGYRVDRRFTLNSKSSRWCLLKQQ